MQSAFALYFLAVVLCWKQSSGFSYVYRSDCERICKTQCHLIEYLIPGEKTYWCRRSNGAFFYSFGACKPRCFAPCSYVELYRYAGANDYGSYGKYWCRSMKTQEQYCNEWLGWLPQLLAECLRMDYP